MTNITARFALVLVCACAMSVLTFIVLAIFSEPLTVAPETLEQLVEFADSANADGVVEADSVLRIRKLDESETADWTRAVNADDDRALKVLVPSSEGRGFAEVSVSRTNAEQAVRVADRSLLIGTSLVFGIFVLTAVVLAWPLVSRIQKQEQAIAKLADGDLSARVEVGRQDVVGRLSARINTMADRIQELIESHESLLQTVSHEMRTPISRMHFSLQLLQESIVESSEDSSKPDHEKRFAAMREDMQELDTLLGELLTFSRLQSGDEQRQPESVAMQRMLKRIVDSQSESFPAIAGSLDCVDDQILIQGTENLLHRAIHNVVRNAFRFAASRVDVAMICEDESCVIHLRDDGPGVPEEDRTRVFEPFVQLEGNASDGGTGLGLAIAKRIVEMHGGTIGFKDCDAGACCRIVLPNGNGL